MVDAPVPVIDGVPIADVPYENLFYWRQVVRDRVGPPGFVRSSSTGLLIRFRKDG
jgi:hypothetical protein